MNFRDTSVILTAGLSAVTVASGAYGQAAGQAAVERTASIESVLEWNDNYDLQEDSPGDSFIWSNILAYQLWSRSPVDTFSADISGNLRYWNVPDQSDETAFDDPTVVLDYARNISDNSVGGRLFLNKVDVDFYDPLYNIDIIDDEGEFDNVRGGGGQRYELRANAYAALGQEAPFSLDIGAAGRVIDYQDTTDPDLNSRNNARANIEAGFLVTPILRATLGAAYREQWSDEARVTNRTTTTVDTGFNGEIDERSSVRLRIGYSQVDSERDDRPDETDESVVGSLNYALDLPNGSARAGYSSRLTENGTINSISVTRELEFRTGSLTAVLGASSIDGENLRPTGRLVFNSQGRRSQFNATLFQGLTVDDESRDVLNSYGTVSYTRSLTRLAYLGLYARAGLTRYENDERPDQERMNLTAEYNHQLSANWRASLGYTYETRDTEESDGAESNAVFFALRRNFRATR